jgi:putative transposase
MNDIYTTPLHTPPHWFVPNAIYMVTGATLYKKTFLNSDTKRKHFCETLFARASTLGWTLEAWSVLANHYHFMARAPENAHSLKLLIQGLHSISAKFINVSDGTPGRRVWYNYWDACISHETSYWARLNYVHQNPVKHGIVANAEDYSYCSYRWFIECAEPKLKDKILNQPVDRINLDDDF